MEADPANICGPSQNNYIEAVERTPAMMYEFCRQHSIIG